MLRKTKIYIDYGKANVNIDENAVAGHVYSPSTHTASAVHTVQTGHHPSLSPCPKNVLASPRSHRTPTVPRLAEHSVHHFGGLYLQATFRARSAHDGQTVRVRSLTPRPTHTLTKRVLFRQQRKNVQAGTLNVKATVFCAHTHCTHNICRNPANEQQT